MGWAKMYTWLIVVTIIIIMAIYNKFVNDLEKCPDWFVTGRTRKPKPRNQRTIDLSLLAHRSPTKSYSGLWPK